MKSERKTFTAEVKEFDDEKLIVTHFISTERRDRGGDVMKADGMKVKGKAVVLMAHGFSGMGQEPIAKPLKLWADTYKGSPGICARTQFYDGSHLNPPDSTGRRLYEKAKNGFMPNWSIGYIPLKWEDGKGPKGEYYRDVLEWELLEYSPVGVPMNPDAQCVDKCGKCMKESWFKILPNGVLPREVFKKEGSFSHYKSIDGESLWDDDADQAGRLKFEERTYGELCQYKDGQLVDMEGKPYPNEHACRLHPPTGYKRIRRNNDKFGKGIHAIWGVKQDDSVELQAIRFSKDKFTAKEARQWCKDHEYSCRPFEAATEKCEECDGDMVVYWSEDVGGENEPKTMDVEFNYVCPICEEKKKPKPDQCKCEKCGHTVEWTNDCDGTKCSEPGCPGTMKTAKGTFEFETKMVKVRWNKSLPVSFDLEIGDRPPAAWEYDLYRKFLKCEIKEIFMNEYQIPSPLLGTYLAGIKQIFEKFNLLDTRNFTLDGAESPPLHEVIKLNSTKSDDFLVSGIQFYKCDQVSLVLKFTPNWYGIRMAVITSQKQKVFNKDLFEKIHQWVKENNFLKGERFALSGEFLERTKDVWDDLILDDDLKKIIRNAVNQLNIKKQEMKSRGLLFVGRPGTGKTKMGRTIMNDSGSTFVWVSSKDFQYGSSVGMISLAFELAKDLSPAIIFLEDIDTWIGNYLVDLLKTEMDGLRQNMGIVTILTSNNPENLPDALLDRPGRFHHVLDFKLPNSKQRLSMMKLWTEGKVDEKVLLEIAKETEGFSGAHVRELIDFAKIISEEDNIGIGIALRESLNRLMKQRDLINQIRTNQKLYQLPVLESKAIRSDQADSVKFVVVDGDQVREKNNIDFTMGAHHYIPQYEKIIPEDEIWLDQSMDEMDTLATKLHEFIERLIMKYLNWEYNDAHEIASKPERLLRHVMWAETDEAWGDEENGNSNDENDEDEEDWEEYDSFIKDMILRSAKILERINKAREEKGFKPLTLKVKEVKEDEIDSFIDFIKTMKERFKTMEEKIDSLVSKLQEGGGVKSGAPALDGKTDLPPLKDNQPEPEKIVAIDKKAEENRRLKEEKERLAEMSKQLSEQFNEVLRRYEESTRQLVRSEINKARGRVD